MELDAEGELHFDALKGSEHVLAADTVIFAIGEDLDLSFLPKEIKVDKGRVLIDEDGATSHKRFFAGGDVAVRQGRVAYAIGAGRRAAQAIDNHLMGFEKQRRAKGYKEYTLLDTDFFEKKPGVPIPELPVHERRRNLSEVERGLDYEQGMMEASRCLDCRGMCQVACPYGSPSFGAEDNAKMQKCDLCLEELMENRKPICVRACTMRALDAGPIEELRAKYGDVREAAGFTYSEKGKPSIVFKPKAR
jgi:ferredoxin